jgi:putative Mn2+ efflux pump MntP
MVLALIGSLYSFKQLPLMHKVALTFAATMVMVIITEIVGQWLQRRKNHDHKSS